MATAQDLLDQLHEVGISELYVRGIPKREHLSRIKLAKQEIRIIKRQLRQEQDVIKRRWDGRNRVEGLIERVELLPYSLIDDLISEIEVFVSQLEHKVEFEEAIPSIGNLPEVIIEDDLDGEYIARLASFDVGLEYWLDKGKVIKAQYQKNLEELKILEAGWRNNPVIKRFIVAILFLSLMSTTLSLVWIAIGSEMENLPSRNIAISLAILATATIISWLVLSSLLAHLKKIEELKGQSEQLQKVYTQAKLQHETIKTRKLANSTGLNKYRDSVTS